MRALVCMLVVLVTSQAFAEQGQSKVEAKTQTEEKDYNFSASVEPLYLLIRGLGARAEFHISEKLAAGIQAIYAPSHERERTEEDTNYENYHYSYEEYNLGARYMITGDLQHDGVYINPALGYVRAKITQYSEFNLQGEGSAPQFRLTGGYQITRDNIRLAFGGGIRLVDDIDVVVKDSRGNELLRDSGDSSGALAIDVQLGVMF